jgi:HK97 family phage prohead protease
MDLFDARLEVKSLSQTGIFTGLGSVYGNIDQGCDVVAPGALSESLTEWGAKQRMPAMLWQHNSREPIGTYTKMVDGDGGLFVEGQLALKTQRGAEAYELLQMKAISGLSIGFETRDDSYDQKTGVRTIKKADLWEVSLVTFPMNDSARVASVKSIAEIEEINDFKGAERFLRDSCKLTRTEATAFFTRVKGLAQRDSDASDATKHVIEGLRRRSRLLTL